MTEKVHPYITYNIKSNDAKDMYICYDLEFEGEGYKFISKKGETLKDLHELLKKLFDSKRIDSGGQIKFKLDSDISKYMSKTLDEIIEQFDFLNKFERIVICCPLHYIKSNSYKNKIGEDKITKLVYNIKANYEAFSSELKKFYESHYDSHARKEKKIHIFDNLNSMAVQWVDIIMMLVQLDVQFITKKILELEGTY